VNLQQGHFGYISYLRILKMQINVDVQRLKKNKKLTRPNIPERARILGTDVPCIEKRELLVLLHKPLEMRY